MELRNFNITTENIEKLELDKFSVHVLDYLSIELYKLKEVASEIVYNDKVFYFRQSLLKPLSLKKWSPPSQRFECL